MDSGHTNDGHRILYRSDILDNVFRCLALGRWTERKSGVVFSSRVTMRQVCVGSSYGEAGLGLGLLQGSFEVATVAVVR